MITCLMTVMTHNCYYKLNCNGKLRTACKIKCGIEKDKTEALKLSSTFESITELKKILWFSLLSGKFGQVIIAVPFNCSAAFALWRLYFSTAFFHDDMGTTG